MNPVVHFEMPYQDSKRVSDFYQKAFNWKMNLMGEQMANYIVAQTTETDGDMMVKTPGNINGGFFEQKAAPESKTSVVISVDDIQAAMEKVKEAGGKIEGHPVEIPGIGQFVTFEDTEGNHVSILQPKKM